MTANLLTRFSRFLTAHQHQ